MSTCSSLEEFYKSISYLERTEIDLTKEGTIEVKACSRRLRVYEQFYLVDNKILLCSHEHPGIDCFRPGLTMFLVKDKSRVVLELSTGEKLERTFNEYNDSIEYEYRQTN